jgi:hypothetical protein
MKNSALLDQCYFLILTSSRNTYIVHLIYPFNETIILRPYQTLLYNEDSFAESLFVPNLYVLLFKEDKKSNVYKP